MGKKADQELQEFLVHCFGTQERFEQACLPDNLFLLQEMLFPSKATPEKIIEALNNRTTLIKNDLIDFFDNLDAQLF